MNDIRIIVHTNTAHTFHETVRVEPHQCLTYDDILTAFRRERRDWLFIRDGQFIEDETVHVDECSNDTLHVYVVDVHKSRENRMNMNEMNMNPQPTPPMTTLMAPITTPMTTPIYSQIIQGLLSSVGAVGAEGTDASVLASLREMGFTQTDSVLRTYIRIYGPDVESVANALLG